VVFPTIDHGVWKEVSRKPYAAAPGDDASFVVLVYERPTPGAAEAS